MRGKLLRQRRGKLGSWLCGVKDQASDPYPAHGILVFSAPCQPCCDTGVFTQCLLQGGHSGIAAALANGVNTAGSYIYACYAVNTAGSYAVLVMWPTQWNRGSACYEVNTAGSYIYACYAVKTEGLYEVLAMRSTWQDRGSACYKINPCYKVNTAGSYVYACYEVNTAGSLVVWCYK